MNYQDHGGKQLGFSILEMVVSIGITAILVIAMSSLVLYLWKSQQHRQLKISKNTLVLEVRKNLVNMNYLKASFNEPVNSEIKKCICIGGSVCNNLELVDFTPFESLGKPMPTRFNSDGAICFSESSACPIDVKFKAMAQCPPAVLPSAMPLPTLQCSGPGKPADILILDYSVQSPETADTSDMALRPIKGKIYVPVSDLLASGGFCP